MLSHAISLWNLARVLKFAGLALFAAGLTGVLASGSRRRRMVMVYAYATPGFVMAYAGGWLLLYASSRPLWTPWVLVGAIAGFSALHLTFLASHLEKPRAITGQLAWGCSAAALVVMVVRLDHDPVGLTGITVAGLLGGTLLARVLSNAPVVARPSDREVAWRGLVWITWIEGASLLLMLFVSMPLRLGLGVSLDRGTGLLGWFHGIVLLVFVQTLATARSLFGLPRTELAVGICSAMLPGGSFWFERRLRRRIHDAW